MAASHDRRWFLKSAVGTVAGVGMASLACGRLGGGGDGTAAGDGGAALDAGVEPLFRISLAEWSLHRALNAGELDHLDFARVAVQDYGCEGLEYVNVFFFDKFDDRTYLAEMKMRALR